MSRSWAVVTLARDAAHRFALGWREIEGKPRFAAWLLGGFALSSAVAAALALVGHALAERGVLDAEPSLLLRFAQHGPLDFQQALFLSQPGSTATILPLALVAAWIAVRRDRPLHALAALATAVLTKVIVGAGWLVWHRDRPELVAGGIAAPQGLSSFPSGHVAQTVAFYGLLIWWWCARSRSALEKTLAWALFAALVVATAAARLRLGAHWPSDLVAGAAVGGLWLVACGASIRAAGRAAPGSASDRGAR